MVSLVILMSGGFDGERYAREQESASGSVVGRRAVPKDNPLLGSASALVGSLGKADVPPTARCSSLSKRLGAESRSGAAVGLDVERCKSVAMIE